MACALSRLGRFRDAQEPLLMAVNELGVKYSVCAEDPDLEDFRNSSEWLEIQDYMVGGAGAESREAKLRAEATQPFLLARLLVLGGLDLGALTGLLIITPRLLSALSGVEAPTCPPPSRTSPSTSWRRECSHSSCSGTSSRARERRRRRTWRGSWGACAP